MSGAKCAAFKRFRPDMPLPTGRRHRPGPGAGLRTRSRLLRRKTLRRVVPVTLAALIVLSLLSATGVMDGVAAAFDPLLRAVGLLGESAAALVAQFVTLKDEYPALWLLVLVIRGMSLFRQNRSFLSQNVKDDR